MKIEIIGSGCRKCKATETHVRRAVAEPNIVADICKIEDMAEIVDRGIMLTPAVMINNETVISGEVPSVQKLKQILMKYTQ